MKEKTRMHPRGHRAIGALAVLFAVLIGATALLPLGVLGQTTQVTGLVSTCGPVTPYVIAATVTLIDANAINPSRTTTTNGGGVYAFVNPPSGSYTVAVNRSGYYSNTTGTPQRYDGSRTVPIDLCMHAYPTPSKTLTVNVLAGGAPVSGATVAAYNVSNPTLKVQLVTTATTNAAGFANLTLWSGVFQLRTSAADYQTDQSSVDVSITTSKTINLVAGLQLFGHARDPSGNFLGEGLVAWLYNPSVPETSAYRLIPATVRDSLYDFRAPAGTYQVIIDANRYAAHRNTVTLPVTNPYDVVLQPAPAELYQTTVLYGEQDWNNLTAWRNLTLNADSTLTGLAPANLRDLRLQIDATRGIGDGDGTLEGTEITAFDAWLTAKGPAYVTTDGFFTTNGKSYNSSASYSVTVEGLASAGRVWINTTWTYSLKQAPPYIASGARTYNVTVTMIPDTNVSVYQDYVYLVALPLRYELNTSRVQGSTPVSTRNFTRVTIDPGLGTGSSPQLIMTVSESVTGTARAKVTGPSGKFHVVDTTPTNYQALVANNTTLTFSAQDSYDPNGHIADANFTWRFAAGPGDVRYGITPTYKYTQSDNFTVNLTVVETGGNVTYRNITVHVDDQLPIARIRTNATGGGNANGTTLRVDEGTLIRFDGALSTDLAYVGKNGVILDSGYSWDFDGDRIADATGRVVNRTFQKPGEFKVNLTVTDSVGWKSVNATMTAIVNDTTAAVPGFDILDPEQDWAVIMSPMERKTIALNGSKTTDEYDNDTALNFTWTVPGPLIGFTGTTNHTFYGINVTFAWAEWNTSYNVRLSVRDTGFRGSGMPAKPNYGNLSRNTTVQIDVSIHADLRVDAGTMKVNPADPEEGGPVTVSVNVTNKANRAKAGNVTTRLLAISGGQTIVVTSSADWFDKDGVPKGTNHTILSGETVRLEFHFTLSGQGNKTLRVCVNDATEPYTWNTAENCASTGVNVRQPWWQPYAIWGSVIGVIVLFVFGMYARRKVKAGEWRPIRGRGKEGEEEERRPKREIKEEKKRL